MILITGASGLLGSHLAKTLVNQGFKVKAIKRKQSKIPEILTNLDITWEKGSLSDPIFLLKSLTDVKSIFHCAAQVSFDKKDARRIVQENVEITKSLLNASIELGIKDFVHFSSVAALSRNKKNQTIDENNKWQASKYNTAYATSKYYAEIEVWRAMEEGLTPLILNPSVILGPGDINRSSTQIFKYVWNENIFYIQGKINVVDVRDVIEATLFLWKKGIKNERFILSAHEVSYKYFLSLIALKFGKKPPYVKVPLSLIKSFVFMQNMASIILGTKSLISEDLALAASIQTTYNTNKINKLIGTSCRPLDDTLSWVCNKLLKTI